jgi:tripartite-type tricarboxylate transporter receptor subunit TctC
MNFQRRRFLRLTATIAAFSSLIARTTWAQAYPTRPVRLIVGFPPGGTTDIIARMIAQWLSERLGHQFIIENRPGANTTLAVEAVARAPADGYTLGTLGPSNLFNSMLYQQVNFDLIPDLAMVAGLNNSPLVLEVHPMVPVNSVPEFISYVKASPSSISMASFGTGSISHVAGELFKMAAGINMMHVPYRGSAPMLIDLLSGQVQAVFDNLPASIEYIRAGKLRALAVTTTARSGVLPGIPSLGEFLPGYEANAFLGLGAPKDTPVDIIERLNKEINAGLRDTKIRERLAELGGAPLVLSPGEFSHFVVGENEKWTKLVREAKIKAE